MSSKYIVTKDQVYDRYKLFDINAVYETNIAEMWWVGTSEDGVVVKQPAITTKNEGISLAFDGQANFINSTKPIYMPNNGTIFTMEPNTFYYFKDYHTDVPDKMFSLKYDNESIRMNNISLFKEDFSMGVMMDLRASMEGSFTDSTKTGFVVVLSSTVAIT